MKKSLEWGGDSVSIDQLCKRLMSFSGSIMKLNAPVSKESMNAFQNDNGISLPESFSELLQHFDGGELFVPGTTIYGISNEQFETNTLNSVNAQAKRSLLSIPPSFFIIGKLNFGDYVCLDLNEPHEIVQWDHETDKEFYRWGSLETWLEDVIDDYLNYSGDNRE